MTKKLTYLKYGELVHRILDSTISNKMEILLSGLDTVQIRDYELLDILPQLDELDHETFGKISAFCLLREISNKHNTSWDKTSVVQINNERNKKLTNHMVDITDEDDTATMDEEFNSHIQQTNRRDVKKRNTDRYENIKPERDQEDTEFIKRPKLNELNVVKSFHRGRPCIKCNKMADFFNERGEKVSMPFQHKYASCPFYCNICKGIVCNNILIHLKYSCILCNSTYCNHSTKNCEKYR